MYIKQEQPAKHRHTSRYFAVASAMVYVLATFTFIGQSSLRDISGVVSDLPPDVATSLSGAGSDTT